MFCQAKFAVCSRIHTKHKITMWSQCRIFYVKPCGTYSYRYALKCYGQMLGLRYNDTSQYQFLNQFIDLN